jgi:hypothetical protein
MACRTLVVEAVVLGMQLELQGPSSFDLERQYGIKAFA